MNHTTLFHVHAFIYITVLTHTGALTCIDQLCLVSGVVELGFATYFMKYLALQWKASML